MLAKRLVNYLPTSAQKGITAAWRKIRGNPELHVLEILNDRSAPHWRPSNQPIRSGTSKCEIVVPLHRLDDLELETVGVIKIDAEGHELAVLGGAHDLIARDRPNVMIEVEDRHRPGSLAAVRSFFDERGYEGFFLVGRRIAPIAQFDPALHQDPSWVVHDRVAIDKNYVNTFIFTASPRLMARLLRSQGPQLR